MKCRWRKGAVEGNVRVSELMVVPFTEIRDPIQESSWSGVGGWVMRSVWDIESV